MSTELSTWEVESGGSDVQGPPWLLSEFEDSVHNRKPCLKQWQQKETNKKLNIKFNLPAFKAFRFELLSGALLIPKRKDYNKGLFMTLEPSVHLGQPAFSTGNARQPLRAFSVLAAWKGKADQTELKWWLVCQHRTSVLFIVSRQQLLLSWLKLSWILSLRLSTPPAHSGIAANTSHLLEFCHFSYFIHKLIFMEACGWVLSHHPHFIDENEVTKVQVTGLVSHGS